VFKLNRGSAASTASKGKASPVRLVSAPQTTAKSMPSKRLANVDAGTNDGDWEEF
jgi:hypothetical protein